MRAPELAKMYNLEDTYWWFVARRRLAAELLERYKPPIHNSQIILDVGCGTGATLSVLEKFGPVVGIDSSPESLHYSWLRNHRRLVRARAEALPVASHSVDIITALDLLEHLRDDAAAVKEFVRALRPGGLLLVTVPAGPYLWSEHDEALDHLRRYRAVSLRSILEQAGLYVQRLSPLITMLLIPIAAFRALRRLLPRKKGGPQTAFIIPPRPVNWLLTILLHLETRWLLRLNLPFGVSLMAIARKL